MGVLKRDRSSRSAARQLESTHCVVIILISRATSAFRDVAARPACSVRAANARIWQVAASAVLVAPRFRSSVGGAGSQTPQPTGIAGAVATLLQYPSRKRPYPERVRCSHTKLSADSSQ